VPRQERQISVCALVADEVFLALKATIDDTDHTDHFLAVSLDGARDLLRVDFSEPCCLAIIGSCGKMAK
jgi:hypothetical protein